VETVHSDHQWDQTDPNVVVPDLSMKLSSLDLGYYKHDIQLDFPTRPDKSIEY